MLKKDENNFILLLKEYGKTFREYDGRLDNLFSVIYTKKFRKFIENYNFIDNTATIEFTGEKSLNKVRNYLINNLEYSKDDFTINGDILEFPLFEHGLALKEQFKKEKDEKKKFDENQQRNIKDDESEDIINMNNFDE